MWMRWSSQIGAPSIVLFVYTNIIGFEECFFAMIGSSSDSSSGPNEIGQSLVESLRQRIRPSRWRLLWNYMLRIIPLLGVGMMVTLLQRLPYIHTFVPSLWIIQFTLRLHRQNHDRSLWKLIGLILLLILIIYLPLLQHICYNLFQFYLSTLSLTRELFDTYLSRLEEEEDEDDDGTTKKDTKKMKVDDVKDDNERTSSLSSSSSSSLESSDMRRPFRMIQQSPGGPSIRYERTLANSDPSTSSSSSSSSPATRLDPLPHSSSRMFLSRHGCTLLGLGVTFILPFRLSNLFGLILAPVSHAAAGYVLKKIVVTEIEQEASYHRQHEDELEEKEKDQMKKQLQCHESTDRITGARQQPSDEEDDDLVHIEHDEKQL